MSAFTSANSTFGHGAMSGLSPLCAAKQTRWHPSACFLGVQLGIEQSRERAPEPKGAVLGASVEAEIAQASAKAHVR
jgi:hypothetical protein